MSSLLEKHVAPLTRSIAAAIAPNVPSRSHGVVRRAEHLGNEGDVSWWSPYLGLVTPQPYAGPYFEGITNGGAGTPEPVHNRAAFGTAYVTPANLWNLAGISSGWSSPGAPTPSRPPTAKLAFGRLGSLLAAGGPQPHAPLPTLPEPARMVAPQF